MRMLMILATLLASAPPPASTPPTAGKPADLTAATEGELRALLEELERQLTAVEAELERRERQTARDELEKRRSDGLELEVVTRGPTYFYPSPSVTSRPRTMVPSGTSIVVQAPAGPKWWKTSHNGKAGFILLDPRYNVEPGPAMEALERLIDLARQE